MTTCSSCSRPTPIVVVLDGVLRLCVACIGKDLEPKPRPTLPTATHQRKATK